MPFITDPDLQKLDATQQMNEHADDLAADIFNVPITRDWVAPKIDVEEPTTGETFKAAFEQENLIGSAVSYFSDKSDFDFTDEEDFNVFDEDLSGYEDYLDEFDDVRSQGEMDFVKKRIETGIENQQIIAESGGMGIAAMLTAGILDPTILIPIAGTAYKATRAATAIASAGKTAAAVGTIEAGREAALHQLQPTRTIEESAINVSGAMILGGVMGGTIAGLSKGNYEKAINDIDEFLDSDLQGPQPLRQEATPKNDTAANESDFFDSEIPEIVPNDTPTGTTGGKDGGAALNKSYAAEQKAAEHAEKLVGGKFTEAIVVGPAGRLASSVSVTANKIGRALANDNWLRNFHKDGIKSEVTWEQLITNKEKDLLEGLQGVRAQQKAYSKRLPKKEREFNEREFNEQVSTALRNGDEHHVPEIKQAATEIRTKLERIKDDAIAARLLDENTTVMGALSYLPRSYNRKLITENINDFRAQLTNQIKHNVDEDVVYVDDVVENIINNILGRNTAGSNHILSGPSASRFKGRKLNLSDEFLTPWLENDAEALYMSYHKSMTPQIEFVRKFRGKSLHDLEKEITEDFAERSKGLPDGKKQLKLEKERAQLIDDIRAIYARGMGTSDSGMNKSGWASRTLRTARKYNVTKFLGGVTISSLPDIARPIIVNGVGRYAGMIAKLVANPHMAKLSLKEKRSFAAALEIADFNSSRTAHIGDIVDDYRGDTTVERAVDYISHKSQTLFGLQYHNTFWKAFTGLLTEEKILLAAGKKVGTKQRQMLARIGIDDDMAKRIAQQYDEFGESAGGLQVGNHGDWTDVEAAEALQSAVSNMANSTINTPGIGTLPIMFDKEAAKSILQFKTFLVASHNQTLVAGLQQADMATASSAIAMVGIGAAVVSLKDSLAGREQVRTGDELLLEAVDRSGLMSMLIEGNNISNKFGGPSINETFGIGPSRRYRSRGQLEAVVGPSSGIVTDAGTILAAATGRKDLTESDVAKMRRALPFQNLFYTRWLFDEVEEGLKKELGAK